MEYWNFLIQFRIDDVKNTLFLGCIISLFHFEENFNQNIEIKKDLTWELKRSISHIVKNSDYET